MAPTNGDVLDAAVNDCNIKPASDYSCSSSPRYENSTFRAKRDHPRELEKVEATTHQGQHFAEALEESQIQTISPTES
jgi:hypothetical protein